MKWCASCWASSDSRDCETPVFPTGLDDVSLLGKTLILES